MKKALKDIKTMTITGVTGAVGSKVLIGTGTTAGTQAAAGVGQITGGLGLAGSISGAGMSVRMLKELNPKKKKR